MHFDHFDLIAGFYERVGPYRISDLLLEKLSLSFDHLLLDAGGGTGRISVELRNKVKEVFVVDLSHGMTQQAALKGLPTVCAPAESLPFSSGSFDRIIMVDTFHHVINQRQTAHELFRVLIPGGRMVIVEPDIHQFFVKVLAIGEKVLLMKSHFLSGEKIASLFNNPEETTFIYYGGLNVISIAEKC